jgi:hypothetical protein
MLTRSQGQGLSVCKGLCKARPLQGQAKAKAKATYLFCKAEAEPFQTFDNCKLQGLIENGSNQ